MDGSRGRGWRRRLRRKLRPPRQLRPTRAGWVFFALTLGIGFASLNTGNNLLYMVFSLLLAFLVLSGVLSESALRGIQVRRRLPAELHAERPGSVVLEVRNGQRRFPSFAIVVEDLLGREIEGARTAGRAFALRVDPGACEARAYRLTPERRGRLALAGFRVSTRFPFGLFSKSMRLEAPAEALVFPAIDPLRPRAPLHGARARANADAGSGGASPESAELREWAPGDALRRVHWRASLRKGSLLVREPEPEEGADHLVVLPTAGVSPGAAFEGAVRRAASEVVAYLDAGFRVGLSTDHARFESALGRAARARMLRFLAEVEPAPGHPAASGAGIDSEPPVAA